MAEAFNLTGVSLGYDGHVVLRVDELRIPKGCMTFVIGPSGTGKSTLLESIGLMSDTFVNDPSLKHEFWIEGERFDPATLWSTERHRLAQIRKERFSFIFQSTNLMPNFTVGENIRMAAFDHSEDGPAMHARIEELMQALHLPLDTLDKPAHAISGGQRQRVAFIRALVKDFSVLLADEPTGNLDPANAIVLFDVLKHQITAHGRTAVVVTHHLDLADRFGDLILELQPPSSSGAPATVSIKRALALA